MLLIFVHDVQLLQTLNNTRQQSSSFLFLTKRMISILPSIFCVFFLCDIIISGFSRLSSPKPMTVLLTPNSQRFFLGRSFVKLNFKDVSIRKADFPLFFTIQKKKYYYRDIISHKMLLSLLCCVLLVVTTNANTSSRPFVRPPLHVEFKNSKVSFSIHYH